MQPRPEPNFGFWHAPEMLPGDAQTICWVLLIKPIPIMAELPAKQRKRNAIGTVKNVAAELGLSSPRPSDLAREEFLAFHATVLGQSRTPEHKKRLEEARGLYFAGQELPNLPNLPELPGLQTASSSTADASRLAETGAGFRLRSTACLFTWNSAGFATMVEEQLWSDFLGWLKGLPFIVCWTATLEKSLKSKDAGRLHLHAYVA